MTPTEPQNPPPARPVEPPRGGSPPPSSALPAKLVDTLNRLFHPAPTTR